MRSPKTYIPLFFAMILIIGCGREERRTDAGSAGDLPMVISEGLSNQSVSVIAEDSYGYIWIGTSRGLNRYNGYNFHQFYNVGGQYSIPDNTIVSILQASSGELWVGTKNGISRYTDEGYFENIPYDGPSEYMRRIEETPSGRIIANSGDLLLEYDPETHSFRQKLAFAQGHWLINFHCDRNGRIWLMSDGQMVCRDVENYRLIKELEYTGITFSTLLNNGWLWMITDDGFSIYDTNNNRSIETAGLTINEEQLWNDVILGIYDYDPSSVIISTRSNGLFLYNILVDKLISQTDRTFPFEVPNSEITHIYVDKKENVWIGTRDKGFSVAYNYSKQFNNNVPLTAFFNDKSVISITNDPQKGTWFLTRRDGLFRYDVSGDISRIDYESSVGIGMNSCFVDSRGRLWMMSDTHVYQCRVIDGKAVPDRVDYIYNPRGITEDRSGRIWIGGYGGWIYIYDGAPGGYEQVRITDLDWYITTNDIITLSDGRILCSSYLLGLTVIDPDDLTFYAPLDISPLRSRIRFIPSGLYEDSAGNIWIGTLGNGLFRYTMATGEVSRIEGLACDEISGIEEDALGHILISTLDGLARYDPTVGKIQNYSVSDGIWGMQFNQESTGKLADNTLVFGCTNGVTLFNPMDIVQRYSVPLYFEDLYVDNQLSLPYSSEHISSCLAADPEIVLTHQNKSFSISFAALDYGEYPRVHYNYMLEGYDKDWHESHHVRQATYIRLPAGRYKLLVEARNNNDGTVEATGAIDIRVRPSVWASPAALYICYPLLLAVIVLAIWYIVHKSRRNRDAIAAALREKEEERRINKMNMSFFSNVSHEFRTPLQMISGPVSMLIEKTNMDTESRKLLGTTQRNVNRMLRIVNQMMDFGKLEEDVLKLNVQQGDIVSSLCRTVEAFRYSVQEKGIALNTSGLEGDYVMWFDEDKLDKILFNLLSNALKYTPANSGCSIKVGFDIISREEASKLFNLPMQDAPEQYAQIIVADNGIGIPTDMMDKIFDRYSQVDNDMLIKNYGTGIGLYYAKRLASLHHGNIKAESGPSGGSTFTLILPLGDNVYLESEKVQVEKSFVNEGDHFDNNVDIDSVETEKDGSLQTILVVEDDPEVTSFLRTILSPYYNVVTRFDASVAFGEIEQINPDIIITDVVMPGMDGYQFCHMVKNNLSTCHLPVIMLTAKSMVADQIQGLEHGADAYVVKPFEPSYLLALVRSSLANRDKVRSILGQATQIGDIEGNEILSPQDRLFMKRLYDIMETELSMPELNVGHITTQFKISRSKFYYKFKSLLNENPNSFFKTYKLNRATELIQSGEYNISEIADMTGFSSLSHFSASFKKHFGITPSEYVKNPSVLSNQDEPTN